MSRRLRKSPLNTNLDRRQSSEALTGLHSTTSLQQEASTGDLHREVR